MDTNKHELKREIRVAIACGGTGGHLFPGLAVGEELRGRGCAVTLLVSPKEVDQQAVKAVSGMEIVTLPAVGLSAGSQMAFLRGFFQSYLAARRLFRRRPIHAAIAMGGFTSAPPILAAKLAGARTFLHESNSVPGRANRWLSWIVDRAFVGFPDCAKGLHARQVSVSGTPVRPAFEARDAAECRLALKLDPLRPMALVMGGSQGASGLNELVMSSLPYFARTAPELQWFHLTGPNDAGKVGAAYEAQGLKAMVHPFFSAMELALGAASAAISRAGASSLAELAALQVPAVLVPYPAATDNHQFHNAAAFVQSGAARLLEQGKAKPEELGRAFLELIQEPVLREHMRGALSKWHAPRAAAEIAEAILEGLPQASINPERQRLRDGASSNEHLPAVIA
jgi:UDP-N-acetylglucosamine--N-acetylmuramyl-(pentapeptide) pyrophosphoryl-undecaprenol N-acetylglucosamine transferase